MAVLPRPPARRLRPAGPALTRASSYLGASAFLAALAGLGGSAGAGVVAPQAVPATNEEDRARRAARALAEGVARMDAFEYEQALVSLEEALRLQRDLGDRRAQAEILVQIGAAYDRLGDTRRHVQTAREVVEIRRLTGDRREEATALTDLAGAYANSGALQEALDLFRETLTIHRELGDRTGEAQALGNVGSLHEDLGDSASAIVAFEQELPIWHALGDRVSEANSYNNRAAAHSSLGDSQKALALYREALSLLREDHAARLTRVAVLNNLGYELNSLGSYAEARSVLEEGLGIALEVGSTGHEAAVRVNLGAACAGLGQPREAREHYERALAIARARGDGSREAKALERMAQLARDAGDLDEARSLAEATIDSLESVRRGVNSIRLRSSFIASVHRAYALHVDVLMALHRERPAGGFDARALRASELARARALLDNLGDAQARITAGVDRSLIDEERALQDRLSAAVDRHMRLATSGATDDRRQAAASEVQALTSEWDAVKGRLRAASPLFAALKDPEPLAAADIQQSVLDEDTVLVEYALGEKRSFLWVVAKGSLASYELPAKAVIEDAARVAYERLTRSAARRAGAAVADDALLRLSRMVLGPAAAALNAKRLLVVADGALHYIPFAALPDPRAADLPLVARHEIVAAPSASAVALLRRDERLRKPASGAVAVIADPVFGPDDERLPRAARAQAAAGNPAVLAYGRHVLRGIDAGDGALPRLPFTGREARAILRLVAPGDRKAAFGFEASRATATDPSLADFRIVHFATHGFLNAAHPELSGIVLSLLDRTGHETRGFLSVADVFNMHLRAQLVVLSACRTALGREIHGEGLVGLSQGFMYAGALRLLASLWRVDDAATAELMTHFYRAVLVRGLPPAAALRAAQRHLMGQARFRDPYYWAGFQLQGEWR